MHCAFNNTWKGSRIIVSILQAGKREQNALQGFCGELGSGEGNLGKNFRGFTSSITPEMRLSTDRASLQPSCPPSSTGPSKFCCLQLKNCIPQTNSPSSKIRLWVFLERSRQGIDKFFLAQSSKPLPLCQMKASKRLLAPPELLATSFSPLHTNISQYLWRHCLNSAFTFLVSMSQNPALAVFVGSQSLHPSRR